MTPSETPSPELQYDLECYRCDEKVAQHGDGAILRLLAYTNGENELPQVERCGVG